MEPAVSVSKITIFIVKSTSFFDLSYVFIISHSKAFVNRFFEISSFCTNFTELFVHLADASVTLFFRVNMITDRVGIFLISRIFHN